MTVTDCIIYNKYILIIKDFGIPDICGAMKHTKIYITSPSYGTN